ncbi:MAG: fumarylacetoacetate hydrolase family protein [Desulfarculales bacterium]|jgi:2-keto-4-pentenoate hydratase/2-oxohepta-3-ene-1,7-dioic acid hydratase in catechol pathway|nr:fumarylacetoacetate hydrolase family protein [Desulfarculales bacterium]
MFDFSENIYAREAVMRVYSQGRVSYALWRQGRLLAYDGSPFANGSLSRRELDPDKVEPLAPCEPGKVVVIGLNYRLHAREMNLDVPQEPLLLTKPSSSAVGFGAAILLPSSSSRVEFEGEMGVVIARTCHEAEEKKAGDYIMGYTCLNDVTARDLQFKDSQFTRAKGFDTFCPLGPAIALDLSPDNLRLRTFLNGEVRQDSSTSDMIFSAAYLVSYVSRIMTLHPGDVIATGTPSGTGPMKEGDLICVELEGVGRLVNYPRQ